MSESHVLTVGQTMSGKTLANQALARNYKSHGIGVVVLDRMRDSAWVADWMTGNVEEFMAFVRDPKRCLQCALFIDDSGGAMNKYMSDFDWLTTESRHHGHVTHIIAQRAQQVSLNIRSQCSKLMCFNVNPEDAKIYARDFNEPILMNAHKLPKGHFYKVERFQPTQLLRMW